MGSRPALALSVLAALGAPGCAARAPAGAPHGAPARPLRVMSINLCTDQLVLALLPPQRIASVSWLARDPDLSVMAARARRVNVNQGEAEEVIAQHPDLIVGDSFGKPVLRAMLRRLGYPLVEVAEPTDLAGIRRATRQVAAAVGERARGEALLRAMDNQLGEIARHPAPPVDVAVWSRDGMVAAQGTLQDAVLSAAGARNVPNRLEPSRGVAQQAAVEALLATDPALLIETGRGIRAAPSRGDAVLRHPLVRRFWRDRIVAMDGAYTTCGTPMIAIAARRLRDRLTAGVRRDHPVHGWLASAR